MAIRARRGRLYLDFYTYLPDGRKVRCMESTGLTDTQKNRRVVEAKDRAVRYHLKNGSFRYLEFFPHGSKAKYFRRGSQGSQTLSEFWDDWLNEKVIRNNTLRSYHNAWLRVGPVLGHMALQEIGEHEILVFRAGLEGAGLKTSTVNVYIMVLCMALRSAKKRGLIKKYPCEEIRRLKEVKAEMNPFSFEELKGWLEFLEERDLEWYDLIYFWSRTGLRPGEMYALKWENVDYFNRKLMVRETRNYGGFDAPVKTEHSSREVDLREGVIVCLKRQGARSKLRGKYVWLNHKGRPLNATNGIDKFRHYLTLAGLQYRSPRQMRHTFATLHIGAGENISWVSKMMGHASVGVTLKKYNRFIPNLTREDGSAFERIMEGGNTQ